MQRDQILAHVLPQFFPAHWLEHPGIVFTDFPSRIRIGYVLQDEGRYSYIVEEEFTDLCLPLEELHAAALINLARLPTGAMSIAKIPNGAEGWISATDDNFAAARILLPEAQREFALALGDEFLVSLPHRDDCFCWSLNQPVERHVINTRNALEQFLQNEYNLTPDILLYSPSGFRMHRQQIAD